MTALSGTNPARGVRYVFTLASHDEHHALYDVAVSVAEGVCVCDAVAVAVSVAEAVCVAVDVAVFDLDADGYQFDNEPSTKVQDALQLGCYDPLVRAYFIPHTHSPLLTLL